MVHTNPEIETSNLILDFEFDQHLGSHKHVINIIMWFRDMGCYNWARGEGIRAPIQNHYEPRLARYIHRSNEDTATYVHRLTDECTRPIFVGFMYFHRFMYREI
jgi:hypothetical protein